MGIFQSPIKMIALIKDCNSTIKEITDPKISWYLSKEGQKAYDAAKGTREKTMYFYGYLLVLYPAFIGQDERASLIRIAYIMANSMDDSSLECAGYPNILDPEKNPLVKYVSLCKYSLAPHTGTGKDLLARLLNKPTRQIFEDDNPYTYLTYANSADGNPDMYKIQRDIIGAFFTDYLSEDSTGFFAPYCFKTPHINE